MSKRLKPFTVYFGTLVFTVILISCSTKDVTEKDIVATWGDTALTVEDFKELMYMRHRNEPTAEKQSMEERLNVLEEYIIRDCKIREAKSLEIDKREDMIKAYDEAAERKAMDILYNEDIRDKVMNDKMIHDFWEHDQFEVRVRHCLIKVDTTVTGKDTLPYFERANDIYEKAESGESFINLIDQFSEDNTIDEKFHGDLGYFGWGMMVDEFQEAAWKLEPGDISPPVRSARFGYHIIQMVDKRSKGLQFRTSHILVNVSRKDAAAETTAAWDRAMEILEEARKPGVDFAQLARKYSEDERTWVNGDIGFIPRGSMPKDYWTKVFTMDVGQIDGPVRSYKGYHIIKVTDKRVEDRPEDNEVIRDGVIGSVARLYRDSIQSLSETYIKDLYKDYNLEYKDDVVQLILRKLGDPSAPTNMNPFSSFTPEERENLVADDKIGGVKIQDMVDTFNEGGLPAEFRNETRYVEELVEMVVMRKYLGERARNKGLFERPEVIQEGVRGLDNALLPKIEEEMIFNKSTPSEDELKKYYDKHPDKFVKEAKATVIEIQVDDKQLAQDLFDRVKKGEDISRLARKYTMREKGKRKDGKLGPFTKDKYGALSRDAFKLEVGDIGGPIETEGPMYSVIRLEKKSEDRQKDFEESRYEIESDIRFERQKKLRVDWENSLKKENNVKYYKDIIKAVWPLIDPLPEPMVEERKKWKKDRERISELAARKSAEDQIKLKLVPGSTQTFTTKEGKQVKATIGQPRYVDKEGKEVDDSKSNLRITKKGQIEPKSGTAEKGKPSIKIKQKSGSD